MQWFLGLNEVTQALLGSLFTYSMTALGAALVFFSGKLNAKFLALSTGAAAGIMLAASFFSLLLPALEAETVLPSYLVVTLSFFLGGGFITATGVALSRAGRSLAADKRKCALLFSAVTLHNIPEGMAVGVAFGAAAGSSGGVVSALLLTLGIGIQNFPEGTCVAYPLKAIGYSNFRCFFLSQASGAVEIVAAIFGALCGVAAGLMPWMLSFSAGAMICVVCSELLPDCFEENKTLASVGILFGFCLMMFLDLALG